VEQCLGNGNGVRLSVCPIRPLQRAAGLLLWAGPKEISIDCCAAGDDAAAYISECGQFHVYS